MTLREKRVSFTNNLARLIIWAGENGIEVAIGPDGLKHMEHSQHYIGLAVDLNAYRGGQYLTSTEEYRAMGDYWKALNPWARWGGDFKDGNHFSYEHEGRK
jgi:hypothetical protein